MMKIEELTTHNLISSYHDSLKIANTYVNQNIIGLLKAIISPTNQETALLGSFYRIHSLATSLTRLNKKVDVNAVALIARTLFEIQLDIKFFSEKKINQNDLGKYFNFPKIQRYQKAKQIIELQQEHNGISDRTLIPNNIRKSFLEASDINEDIIPTVERIWGKTKKGKPNWPSQWHGQSVYVFAAQFGPIYEQEYLEVYSILSSFTHSGCGAYLNFSESTFESIYGVTLEYSRNLYLDSIVTCSKFFKLDKGIEGFSNTLDSLRNMPISRLVEYLKKHTKNIS